MYWQTYGPPKWPRPCGPRVQNEKWRTRRPKVFSMFEGFLQRTLLIGPPILLALTVHECAHAWVALKMGDPTAKMLGRITLNPIRHLDPLGTLALIFSGMFGWAKPVPINPRNFRNISSGMMWVALAGPLSNLALAAVSAVEY